MANVVYNKGKFEILGITTDLLTADVKVILVKNTYTPLATHNFISDLTPGSNELSGTGYSRVSLASMTITEDDTNNVAYLDAADVVYTGINAGTAQYIVLARNTGSDATSPLLGCIDLAASPLITNGSDISIIWPATGIMRLA